MFVFWWAASRSRVFPVEIEAIKIMFSKETCSMVYEILSGCLSLHHGCKWGRAHRPTTYGQQCLQFGVFTLQFIELFV